MKKCCVLNCGNTRNTDEKFNLFGLPKNKIMKKRWKEMLNSSEKITDRSLVCSEHFESKYLVQSAKICRLTKDAVPTIFAKSSKMVAIDVIEKFQDKQFNTSTSSEDIDFQPILNKACLETCIDTSNAVASSQSSQKLSSSVVPKTELDEEETVPMQFPSPIFCGIKSPSIKYIGTPSNKYIGTPKILDLNETKNFKKPKKVTLKEILRTSTSETELSSPSVAESSESKLKILRVAYCTLGKKQKTLLQKLRRRSKKINGLEKLLGELKQQNLIQEEELVKLSGMSDC